MIWQIASTKREPRSKGKDQSDAKASPSRLELTYGLDSAIAQRLQDCYGQLAQLGYKIAGLEAVRPASEKPAVEKAATEPVPRTTTPAPKPAVAEKLADESPKSIEQRPSPRKSRPDASPVRPEPIKPSPEPPNPSFLPGI